VIDEEDLDSIAQQIVQATRDVDFFVAGANYGSDAQRRFQSMKRHFDVNFGSIAGNPAGSLPSHNALRATVLQTKPDEVR
jgi:hypothetical protein